MLPFKHAWLVFIYETSNGSLETIVHEIHYFVLDENDPMVLFAFYASALGFDDPVGDDEEYAPDDMPFRSTIGRFTPEDICHTKEQMIFRYLKLKR